MISAGIVAEYNPIHKGHIYHMQRIRKITDAQCVVVIMSGDFVQRGEPAILDKYTRAECALADGADLVLELPCRYALSSAEQFAAGAVRILSALGTDYLGFGSECGDMNLLTKTASVLADESTEFHTALSGYLCAGLSFPAARMKAMEQIIPEAKEILHTPNNILAIEYIKEIRRGHHTIRPVTIAREGTGYNDISTIQNEFASACALRKTLEGGKLEDIRGFVSEHTFEILQKTYQKTFPIFTDDFSTVLYYRLSILLQENKKLTDFTDVSESLSNRIANMQKTRITFTEFAAKLKSRDMTYSRIMRSLMHILLNHKKESAANDYVRILGFNETGRAFLSNLRKTCTLPIITKPADYKDLLTDDIFASALYNQIVYEKYGTVIADDFRHKIIRNG
jgi:predicted nucleotidyltransferase